MTEQTVISSSNLSRWEELHEEQTLILRGTFAKAAELERENDELRRELKVWKAAYSATEDEHKETKKTVAKLERNMDALKDDNPLLICLIDGDGTIFSQDLWALGRSGGRQAASMLTKGLTENAASLLDGLSTRCQVWLTIYCNRKGLMDVLVSNAICTNEQFEDFVHGFNEASPLFAIVDVGMGKEAADAKIKEHLRLFAKFPQAVKVYLGGTHDNGYSTAINHLVNEGLGGKLVLLKGYKSLAAELKNVDLPQLEVEGLFMARKLTTPPHARYGTSSPKKQPIDFEKFKNKVKVEDHPPAPRMRRFDPTIPLNQQLPKPCGWFYLTHCRNGNKCKYAHDYERTPELMHALRAVMKRTVCDKVAKNIVCPDSSCIFGHYCPNGPNCPQLKNGKCKFTGRDQHKPQMTRQAPNPLDFVYLRSMRVVDDNQSDGSLGDSQERASNASFSY